MHKLYKDIPMCKYYSNIHIYMHKYSYVRTDASGSTIYIDVHVYYVDMHSNNLTCVYYACTCTLVYVAMCIKSVPKFDQSIPSTCYHFGSLVGMP